jgi:hypothetical protein
MFCPLYVFPRYNIVSQIKPLLSVQNIQVLLIYFVTQTNYIGIDFI